MSERIEQSMYERFPFEKWERLSQTNRIQRKWRKVRTRALHWFLKRYLSRTCIAEQKVDLTKISKFTADQFPESGPRPWLDRPDARETIDRLLKEGKISPDYAEKAVHFMEHGYVILDRFFPGDLLDELWAEYERRVFDGKVPVETYQRNNGDLYLGRCLNPHFSVPHLKALSHDPRLLDLLAFLMGVKAIPFQTIMGFAGSEQKPHSDAIHMTTYPHGYLTAAWMAFEDIHPDSGPLEYYPGSHKLDFVYSKDLINAPIDLQYKRTQWYHDVYEVEIERRIRENQFEARHLTCKKGDVLIWHANLVHGGSARKDFALSRKAMVAHYFGKGAVCFGDRNEAMVNPFQG